VAGLRVGYFEDRNDRRSESPVTGAPGMTVPEDIGRRRPCFRRGRLIAVYAYSS
jgi:hypothetical protein